MALAATGSPGGRRLTMTTLSAWQVAPASSSAIAMSGTFKLNWSAATMTMPATAISAPTTPSSRGRSMPCTTESSTVSSGTIARTTIVVPEPASPIAWYRKK